MSIEIIDRPVELFRGAPLSTVATRTPQFSRITVTHGSKTRFDRIFQYPISEAKITAATQLAKRRICHG